MTNVNIDTTIFEGGIAIFLRPSGSFLAEIEGVTYTTETLDGLQEIEQKIDRAEGKR